MSVVQLDKCHLVLLLELLVGFLHLRIVRLVISLLTFLGREIISYKFYWWYINTLSFGVMR